MTTDRVRDALLLAAAVALAACGSSVGASASPTPSGPEAVSASHPSADAQWALDACGFTQFNPDHNRSTTAHGIGVVAGMALITPGRDANKYAPLGPAPEISTDSPLWVITTDSRWLPMGVPVPGEFRNGTCVVGLRSSDFSWFETGDTRDSGVITTPRPDWPATLVLPSLAP